MEGRIVFCIACGFILGILRVAYFPSNWPAILYMGVFGFVLLFSSFFVRSCKNIFMLLMLVSVGILAMSAGEVRTEVVQRILPSAFDSVIDTPIAVRGEIVSDPDIRTKNQQVEVEIQKQGVRTKILAFIPLGNDFIYGEKVEVRGIARIPEPFETTPGHTFRYDQYLEKRGIFLTIPAAQMRHIDSHVRVFTFVVDILFYVKHLFIQGLYRSMPSRYAGLATGLLTGNQHHLDEDTLSILTLSGLVWIVVLSGYHVLLIAEGVLRIFAWMPKRSRHMLAIVAVGAAICATGASAASLRGGVMASLSLYARASGRNYDSLRALCIAAIGILLVNPLLIAFDTGFQLSLLVTPALVLAVPVLEYRLLWIRHAFIREVVSISVIAQLAVLPLLLWQDGELAPWAIPANILVMPFIPFSMLASFIAGISGIVVPHYAHLLGFPAQIVLYCLTVVSMYTASLPYSSVIIPAFSFIWVPILYGLLTLLVWMLKKKPPAQKVQAA